MATHQRQYVSKFVPSNPKVLIGVLVAAAIVNSAVSGIILIIFQMSLTPQQTLGFDASVMNNLNILPSYTEYFSLNTTTTGLLTAGGWMGNMLSCFLMQPVADHFGRKKALLLSAAVCTIGIILQAAAQNIGMFVVARIIVGLGAMLSSAAAPALLAELLPASNRGFVLGFFFSCFYVGSLLAAIVAYGSGNILSTWAWRLPSLLQIIPSLLSLCLLPLLPESPRWLISQGQNEHAREVLMVAAGLTDIMHEKVERTFGEIEIAIAEEKVKYPGNPWIEICKGAANQKRLAILIIFAFMTELLGNFVVSFYLGNILTQAGVTNSNTQLQINVALNCFCFAVAVLGSYLLDVVGRRAQTLGGISGMIVCLYILGGLIKSKCSQSKLRHMRLTFILAYGTSDNKSGIYGTIAVIFLFQGCYSISITPLTALYPTEISQYKLRTTGIAIYRFLECGMG
jgi:MFS family permease